MPFLPQELRVANTKQHYKKPKAKEYLKHLETILSFWNIKKL